ncbi:DUF6655 family protein [Alienimonas californiensis]|uniref:Lipoprotein n=1 Tax=Alienimonas californiensis TaxID=2527989 RepID=A0A517PFJ9_9PLAN|nr:DUF6655 family protein [Alienimonas californiensis]QDT18167.1 hypothetical protein CA12_43080 [Alienimonas californiensis]
MRSTAPAAACAAAVLLLTGTGCATTRSSDTARTAMEQLLVSDAIDRSISKIDLRPLAGKNVFVDSQYLDCVDKGYLISSIRHRVMTSGARLAAKAEEADVIAELRSGGVGTDRQQSYIGTPNISLPGIAPVEIPEVKLWTRDRQMATAKIGLALYDAKTRQPLGSGGMSLARSDDNNTYLMGIGPWQNGTVKESISVGERTGRPINPLPYQVAVNAPPADSSPVRLAEANEDEAKPVPADATADLFETEP